MGAKSRVYRRDKSEGKEFWRLFEEEVESAVRAFGNASIQRDVPVFGEVSRRPRQIDVLAEGEVAGRPMRVVFEAKCYAGRVQIGTIDELVGKAIDVAAQSAVLYAPNGFSAGAEARAEGTMSHPLKIGLAHLDVDWPGADTSASGPLGAMEMTLPSLGIEVTADYATFFRGERFLSINK
jgi:hypothetical protein